MGGFLVGLSGGSLSVGVIVGVNVEVYVGVGGAGNTGNCIAIQRTEVKSPH